MNNTSPETKSPSWLPLESNPQVLTHYTNLLLSGSSSSASESEWAWTDVWGLDPDLLALIPQPALALLLLFPVTEKYEAFRTMQDQHDIGQPNITQHNVCFLRQYIPNACGTIGILHALLNNKEALRMQPGSPLDQLAQILTPLKTPEDRGHALEVNTQLAVVHASTSVQGQTRAPGVDEDESDLHFVCLLPGDEEGGTVVELDGRRPRPVVHQTPVEASFLAQAAHVIREFMDREPDNPNFSILALVPASALSDA